MQIMHFAIVKRVNKLLKRDLDKLMLGTVLPNITTYDHNMSHFRKEDSLSDIDLFLDKYRKSLRSDVMLGYFIHLLTDNFFKDFFNSKIITYDAEGNVSGYIFNGVSKHGDLDTIKKMILDDYNSYEKYILDKGLVDKYGSDECVKDFTSINECNVDQDVLYDMIINTNMDIDKHAKKSFFKKFKKYKFKILPREMYDDLMNKCVDNIVEKLKRVTI